MSLTALESDTLANQNLDDAEKVLSTNELLQLADFIENGDPTDTTGMLIREIATYKQLSPAEQHQQALIMSSKEGRIRYEIPNGKGAPKQEAAYSEEALAARNTLVQTNMRLVVSIAKKHMGRGIPFVDLIQEGGLGMIRACVDYDPHHKNGAAFTTHATNWIRQFISRLIRNEGRTVRLPVWLGDKIGQVLRAQHILNNRLGRQARPDEIAEEIGDSPENVEEYLSHARFPVELDTPAKAGGDETIGYFIHDPDALPVPDEATNNIILDFTGTILESLSPLEARILVMRRGLFGYEKLTAKEVSDSMGIPEKQVKQLEKKAMNRLKKPQYKRSIVEFSQ